MEEERGNMESMGGVNKNKIKMVWCKKRKDRRNLW